ncbi:MAG: hypothetical protein Q4Q23_07915 [Methanobacteriaceae archaeon]|nr:hypothetical protein [Methanobacteriaceae archaeon]
MGYNVSVTRSKLFKEFDLELQKKYFSLKREKFLPHIDTLYYSIFIKNDRVKSNEENVLPDGIMKLVEYFETCKNLFDVSNNNEFWFNYDDNLLLCKRRFSIYDYCIRKEGFYDIFFTKSIPNENTPRIVVQLRSVGLWTLGEYDLTLESYKVVENILKDYNLEIEKTQENRIDFCYHTNSIQNPEKFYNDDCLRNNLKTTFSIYQKVGRKHGKKLTVEYLSLGQRSSNNIFFRSYNKTREVIEQNYKDFFIPLWFKNGLINYYDYYVYTFAFKRKSYNQIYLGMLEFYLNFGNDPKIKNDFSFIKEHIKDYSNEEIKKIVCAVCPPVTLILNIEFQTMRKFYYSFDRAIEIYKPAIEHECYYYQLFRIFQILDNRKLFLDYLTEHVVCFVKDIDSKNLEYLSFWSRLRKLKLDFTCDVELYRDYSRNINKDMIIKRIKGSLATLSLYNNDFDTDLQEDFSNLLCVLNDNDTKVLDDGTMKVLDNEYIRIKENKKKALKSILKNNANSRPLK